MGVSIAGKGALYGEGGGGKVKYEVITSRRSPAARDAAALGASPRERREKRRFLCEGARLCRDAALSGLSVEACFFTAQAREKYEEYLTPLLRSARRVYEIDPSVAQLLADTKSPQGIFCVCGWPKGLEEEAGLEEAGLKADSPCLVLENLQDPGNLGTILRTAEALGQFQVFLLGDCCDPLSPKVLRASMGAVFRLKLSAEPSARRLFALLHSRGYATHGAVPEENARRVTEVDFQAGRHAVIIGNEGSGLTPETLALCGGRVTIPMRGRAESLNAAAAATVLLWEMARGGR